MHVTLIYTNANDLVPTMRGIRKNVSVFNLNKTKF